MNKNEPAFPQISELGDIAATSQGMTLRDYFAAKAMQGMVSAKLNYGYLSRMARDAYDIADAMLEARE